MPRAKGFELQGPLQDFVECPLTAGVINLRKADDELVRELLARGEEAEPDVRWRERRDKLAVEVLVRRPDRANEDALAAPGVNPAFPLIWT